MIGRQVPANSIMMYGGGGSVWLVPAGGLFGDYDYDLGRFGLVDGRMEMEME